MRKDYDDDEDEGGGQQPVIFHPLRVPEVVENLMTQYIPAPDERSATDVIPIGELRMRLACYVPYGSVKEDPLQEYLDTLSMHEYIMQSTTSGPALCLISRSNQRVVNEVKSEK